MKLDASEKLFQSAIIQIALLNGWQMFHATPHQVRPGVFRSDGKGYPDLTLATTAHKVAHRVVSPCVVFDEVVCLEC